MDNDVSIDSKYGYGDISPELIDLYKKLFEICEKAITAVGSAINSDNLNPRNIYSLGFLIKAMNTFKGLYKLGEYQLNAEIQILLRHLFEIIILLKANLNDETFADKYLKSHEACQKKMGNVMKDHPDLFPDEEFELKPMLLSVAKETKEQGISTEWLAKKVEMNDWYQHVYRILSEVVHVKPKTIEHLILSGTNKPVVFTFFPYQEDRSLYLLVACDLMLTALKETDGFYNLSLSEALIEIEKRLALEQTEFNQ